MAARLHLGGGAIDGPGGAGGRGGGMAGMFVFAVFVAVNSFASWHLRK
jgi:hypothetical protein